MAIRIGKLTTKRDWAAIAAAVGETVAQTAILGSDGFSGALSSFFRAVESLRGDDDTELRATRLVFETLGYAVSSMIAMETLGRKPQKAEAKSITENFLTRAQILAAQEDVLLQAEHLDNPTMFPLFADATARVFDEFKLLEPEEGRQNVEARFRQSIMQGLNHIRTRRPDYFAQVIEALSGADSLADKRVRAWDKYRSLLLQRFEDAPLFGEDGPNRVTLGQVYQPLRTWWDEHFDDDPSIPESPPQKKRARVHLSMLESAVTEWLSKSEKFDRIRLISGGPGSGKSTFAKRLAALLALEPRWRVVFVPLQRLKGSGALETQIDAYFRFQRDEPFDADTSPLAEIGRDAHQDWLIIFDGLDELTKEGTGSESAAQDFASALNDLRLRFADSAAVRFLVLGRAPSMQEARRRLGLEGRGTLHVADMGPLRARYVGKSVTINDPENLCDLDQRPEFWARWATAKGLLTDPPEAMKAEALGDLTKEPLLAYLLILSGYVSERWEEAAENRNRIYRAIFEKIWERERTKDTRVALNDLGQEGFEALMQALGLAAWRGGGRTGDEAMFTEMCKNFLRQDVLKQAMKCGVAELSNLALLFYTRRDEEGGRGYEFLHKSFGEYLTSRGLFSAFQRWGDQVDNPALDFTASEFLRRWLKLAGAAPMTNEILAFLRNETRLVAATANEDSPWKAARKWVRTAEVLASAAIDDGLPAHEGAATWRQGETLQRNAEESLFVILDACARAAYPMDLFGADAEKGGWQPGPVTVSKFQSDHRAFGRLLSRLGGETTPTGWRMASYGYRIIRVPFSLILQSISRQNLDAVLLNSIVLSQADLEGASFRGAAIIGGEFFRADLQCVDFTGANMHAAIFVGANLTRANFTKAIVEVASFDRAIMRDTNLDGANIREASFVDTNIENTDLKRAKHRGANVRKDGTLIKKNGRRNKVKRKTSRSIIIDMG